MKMRLGAVVLFLALVGANIRMTAWHATLFDSQTHARTATEAVLSLLGELRGFLARMVWFKTDVYHHLIEAQQGTSEGSKDLIAIHRMVTILDPHFWQSYDLGSWELFKAGNKEGALTFISEGIANNPRERVLWWDKSYLLYRYQQYPQGAECAVQAFVLSQSDLDAINALRIMCANFRGEHDYFDEYRAYQKWVVISPNDITAKLRIAELKAMGADQPGRINK